MNTVAITIKTDPEVKKAAEKKAEELGVSLSSILNAQLRQFVKTKNVSDIIDKLDETPNARTRKLLKQSEEDEKAGRFISFTSPKDAITYLKEEIDDEKRSAY